MIVVLYFLDGLYFDFSKNNCASFNAINSAGVVSGYRCM